MNSERRAIALALVQQAVIESTSHTHANVYDYTVLADIKEIEDGKLCISIFDGKTRNDIILHLADIVFEVYNDYGYGFYKLEPTVSLFGIVNHNQSLIIKDAHSESNFSMTIRSDSMYHIFSKYKLYNFANMHISIVNKICKALYAFINRLPVADFI
jgi:hypothetical protein